MEDLLSKLKLKYPSLINSPNPNCNHCKGTGEKSVLMADNSIKALPCMCLYLYQAEEHKTVYKPGQKYE